MGERTYGVGDLVLLYREKLPKKQSTPQTASCIHITHIYIVFEHIDMQSIGIQ